MHDVRFARDSILERTFKALQLATMVGFASTGPSFSTNIRFENRWAFKSLTVILACSRVLLGLQHAVAASFMITLMKPAYKKTLIMGATYCFMALAHGLVGITNALENIHFSEYHLTFDRSTWDFGKKQRRATMFGLRGQACLRLRLSLCSGSLVKIRSLTWKKRI